MSEYSSFLKVGSTALLLRMMEDPSVVMRDLTLENPIRAIREISHDITCRRRIRLASGREASAFEIQAEYLERAQRFAEHNDLNPEEKKALAMWEHCMQAIEHDPLTLDREVDWVIKYHLLQRYKAKHQIELADPRAALLDLQYHDVNQNRGVFYLMQANGLVERVLDDGDVETAIEQPPQTTRAKLRGDFVRQAKEKKRDYTVDWVHLKLTDQAQRTVLCKVPFLAQDERVESLIESL